MAIGIDYFGKTKKLLDEMPDYVSSFIYRYGGNNKMRPCMSTAVIYIFSLSTW